MSTVSVPLTRGKVAIIDAEDYPLIAPYQWRASSGPESRTWYASTWSCGSPSRRRRLLMHRVIIGAPDSVHVDHRDGDGLNNRRSNLRLATRAENKANSPRYANNRSGHKGVYWKPGHGQFEAQIRKHGKLHFLGYYRTAEAAARAYDAAARELFGEFARLNFPD